MRSIDTDVEESVLKTLREGRLFRYGGSQDSVNAVKSLEESFANALGVEYCLGVNSCTSALYLAILGAGVKPGDGVLIPAFTFVAVPSAVIQAGAIPILVEIDEDYVIDLDCLERAITDNTKYLLLSYMRGRVPDMDRVQSICAKHNLILIEDAAHSLGVKYKDIHTGKFGAAAAFSFQSYKMLDAGEGGLLITDDASIAMRALIQSGCYEENFRKHNLDSVAEKELQKLAGTLPVYNFRMSNLTASALLPQLEKIEDRVQQFNENYLVLESILKESPKIRIPQFKEDVEPVCDSLQFYIDQSVPVEKFEKLKSGCVAQGFSVNLFGFDEFNARCFWNWKFIDQQDLPTTRTILERTADLRLPLDTSLEQLEVLGESILEALH